MSANFTWITSEEQLDVLFNESYTRPVALIKHSDTCGISSDILYQLGNVTANFNVIVVQENRNLSNLVAERINHRHQSPQAFVIKDGKAIYHATHYAISPSEIENKLR